MAFNLTEHKSRRWDAHLVDAKHLLEQNGKLNAFYWAVYMAEVTGLYTHAICASWDKTQKWDVLTTDKELEYHRISQIAHINSPWCRAIGKDRMLKAIQLLEEEQDRSYALEALGVLHETEGERFKSVQAAVARAKEALDRAAGAVGRSFEKE